MHHDPISYVQALILGLVQGVAEPFPISSLGHGVILPRLLGWNIHQNDKFFLTFLVATHLATAIVLFFFFLRDWMRILAGLGRSLRDREIGRNDVDARLGWLLVVGTIPAGADRRAARGLAAQAVRERGLGRRVPDRQRRAAAAVRALAQARAAARRRARRPRPPHRQTLSWRQATAIGAAQAAALVPGISRSGITMGGGLLVGLSNEDAARYGFLLATPIIGAAAVLKLPDLLGSAGTACAARRWSARSRPA